MASTSKLPDPNDENRNKERRFSHERTSPRMQAPSAETPNHRNHRIELTITDSTMDILRALAHEEELSASDIINRALGLYALAQTSSKKGMKLGFIAFSEDGKPELKEIISL